MVARAAAAEGAPEEGEGVVVEQSHLCPQQECLQANPVQPVCQAEGRQRECRRDDEQGRAEPGLAEARQGRAGQCLDGLMQGRAGQGTAGQNSTM